MVIEFQYSSCIGDSSFQADNLETFSGPQRAILPMVRASLKSRLLYNFGKMLQFL
jgi:hypothetical protein